jgi:hypothetical protein
MLFSFRLCVGFFVACEALGCAALLFFYSSAFVFSKKNKCAALKR